MLNPEAEVYLAPGITDMRRSIDGLAAMVRADFRLNPVSDAWFVFCGRRRDRLKILRWDCNGFWLYYRRLERGLFRWPEGKDVPLRVTRRELNWLLDGLTMEQPKAHCPVKVSVTV